MNPEAHSPKRIIIKAWEFLATHEKPLTRYYKPEFYSNFINGHTNTPKSILEPDESSNLLEEIDSNNNNQPLQI